jgi:putative ABC transport system permease protein
MLLVGIGLGFGLIIGFSTGRSLASLLYNVSAWDPPTFFAAIITLAAVAFVACWLPARRATYVDPIMALRAE